MVIDFVKRPEDSLFILYQKYENGSRAYRRAISDEVEEMVYIKPLADGRFRVFYLRERLIGIPTHIKNEGPYRGTFDEEGNPLDEDAGKIAEVLYRIRI